MMPEQGCGCNRAEHCGYFSAEQVQVSFFPELPLRPHTCLEAGIHQEKAPTWEHLDLVFTENKLNSHQGRSVGQVTSHPHASIKEQSKH